jgi:hypothetical protein
MQPFSILEGGEGTGVAAAAANLYRRRTAVDDVDRREEQSLD